jgi:hypothetical protein
VKVFLVFQIDHEEEWTGYVKDAAAKLVRPSQAVQFVLIDNDCPPEVAQMIESIGLTLGAAVQRIERTPRWRIISDILTGQALSGVTEPTLIADAGDARLLQPVQIRGLLGPAGEVSDRLVFTSNPSELMESVLAKTRGWPEGNPFAPGTVASRGGATHVAPLENLAIMFGVDVGEPVAPEEVPPMPPPVHESLVAFYRERVGDQAAGFLVKLQSASQIADDFVDGEMRPEWSADAMRQLLELSFLGIPNDPFYREHRGVLEEVVAQCISVWHLSNELARDYTPESRMWCFVQREAFQMVIWRVAVLVGGLDHGRLVLRELQQALHGPSGVGKKYADWVAETRALCDGR